jgi:hypothetical protein
MEEVRGAQKVMKFGLTLRAPAGFRAGVGKGRNEFMPRRSIWKGRAVFFFMLRKSFFI